MPYTIGPFTVDRFEFIGSVPVSLLAAVSTGHFDLNRLAREELANRGYNQTGIWVGFDRARQALADWERAERNAELNANSSRCGLSTSAPGRQHQPNTRDEG